MRFNTFVSSPADIKAALQAINVGEVLIEPALLAREGKLSLDDADRLAQTADSNGIRPVLVWDALMPQRQMAATTRALTQRNLRLYSAIRTADPGVAFWLKEQFPDVKIQLLVETGSHNFESLRGWEQTFAGSLERLVLSIELPEEKLIDYCRRLTVNCEVLGVGRILLFYSPRALLSSHVSDVEDGVVLSTDHEEEGGHSSLRTPLNTVVRPQKALDRAFPTLETVHGTFLYLDKDQFILDRLDRLREAGLHMLRLDLRHLSGPNRSAEGIAAICKQFFCDPSRLRQEWPRPTQSPFFKTNRTTAQFSRMKSPLHERRDQSCLAEIIGGDKDHYVVYQALRDFAVSQVECIVLPTGDEEIVQSNVRFRDRDSQPLHRCHADQIIVSDWIKNAVPGSLLKGAH